LTCRPPFTIVSNHGRTDRLAVYLRHLPAQEQFISITSVFTNNRSQAVRLPADVRLPEGVNKVQVLARCVDRIISPVGHTWDAFFLNGPKASDDFMVERASQQQPEREAL
jgi:antitoxin VapB